MKYDIDFSEFEAPLHDTVKRYADSNSARFHMPSHGGSNLDEGLYASAKYDLTELGFNDNLNAPSGVIADAEKLLAEAYGVQAALMLTGGTTSAIFVALGALKSVGKTLLIDTFSHKSVFSAARNFGFDCRLLPRRFDADGFPYSLTARDVLIALDENPGVTAVSVTSHDYYGRSLNVKEIAQAVHSRGALLFIDAAHGAHLPLLYPNEDFPRYADLTALGLHKTTPAFTGAAVLGVNCDILTQCLLKRADLHTTSPSYVIMASIDFAREYTVQTRQQFLNRLSEEKRKLVAENPNYTFLPNSDPTRIVVNADAHSLEKFGIFVEMGVGRWSVLIVNQSNVDMLCRLSGALQKLQPQNRMPQINEYDRLFNLTALPVLPQGKTELVDLENCVDRVCAADVGCYPPGVPVLYAGETISAEKQLFLIKYRNCLFNLVKNKICVII